MQWGVFSNAQTFTYKYPITFNSYFVAFPCRVYSSGWGAVISSINNFECTIQLNGSSEKGFVLILGIQQWGYFEKFTTNVMYINLPISYSKKHYAVIAVPGNTSGYGGIRANPYSVQQIRFYANSIGDGSYTSYISLGQQQWGNVSCRFGNVSETFRYPISFSESCNIAIAGATTYTNDGVGSYSITSRNLTQCTVYGDYSMGQANGTALIILIGSQKQWGVADKTASGYSWTFKYPIQFTTFCLPVFTPQYPTSGSSTVRSLSIPSFTNSECELRTDASGTTVKGLCIVLGK